MKRTVLLNRHLSELVASLGHMDEIVVADAGLPVPAAVRVIDLAVSPGVPRFADVLKALRSELVIETAIWAEEANPQVASMMQEELQAWNKVTGKPVEVRNVSHASFKERSAKSKAIVRTGEVTPYANIILVSGVPF
ncbi:MAG: D-ribose pyranase [Roseibium sp.]|nr:D-ribose pyranase [Roseibium sp.]